MPDEAAARRDHPRGYPVRNFGQFIHDELSRVVTAWHYNKLQTDHFYTIAARSTGDVHGRDGSPRRRVNEIYMSEAILRVRSPPASSRLDDVCDVETSCENTTECYNYKTPMNPRAPTTTKSIRLYRKDVEPRARRMSATFSIRKRP